MKEETKELMAEINEEIRNGLNFWADTMLTADADEWAYHLNYFSRDIINASIIFQHVLSNIGIKSGIITEENTEELGKRLRQLVIDMTGYDPAGIIIKQYKENGNNEQQ